MRKIAGLLTTFVVLAILAVVLAATDATAAPCGKLCKPSIAACMAQGFTRRSCKRALVPACKSFHPHDCAFTVDGNGNVSNCPTDYTDCGTGGCCPSAYPFCTSDGQCSQAPDTTSTTTTTLTTTTPTTSTTTSTVPPNPFADYDGTWGYSVSYVTYSGCYTNYPTSLGGTLVLNVGPTGAITGTVGGSVSISGSFTSASSASMSSPAYPDVYGCYTTFDAYTSGWTPSSGTLDVYLYQSCSPGVVCEDLYSGAIAR